MDVVKSGELASRTTLELMGKVLLQTKGDVHVDHLICKEKVMVVVGVVDGVEGLGESEAKLLGQTLVGATEIVDTGQAFARVAVERDELRVVASGGFGVAVVNEQGCRVMANTLRGEEGLARAELVLAEEGARVLIYSGAIQYLLASGWLYDTMWELASEKREFLNLLHRGDDGVPLAVEKLVEMLTVDGVANLDRWLVSISYLAKESGVTLPGNLSMVLAEVGSDGLRPVNIEEKTRSLELSPESVELCRQLVSTPGYVESLGDNATGVTFGAVKTVELENGQVVVIKVPRHVDMDVVEESIRINENMFDGIGVRYPKAVFLGGCVVQPYVHDEGNYRLRTKVVGAMYRSLPPEVPKDSFESNVFLTAGFGPVVVDTA